MSLKKFSLFLFVTFAIAGLLAGSWAPVLAKEVDRTKVTKDLTYQKSTDIYFKKAGVYVPSSNYTGTATLTRIDPSKHRFGHPDLDFVENMLDIHFYDPSGDEFEKLWGINYVYFNLNGTTLQAWKDEELSIYRYDDYKDEWVVCPSFVVKDKSAPKGRLSCVMTDFGRYGLAMEK